MTSNLVANYSFKKYPKPPNKQNKQPGIFFFQFVLGGFQKKSSKKHLHTTLHPPSTNPPRRPNRKSPTPTSSTPGDRRPPQVLKKGRSGQGLAVVIGGTESTEEHDDSVSWQFRYG